MQLGAPLYTAYETPDEWIAALETHGYTAAYCPVDADASEAEIRAYAEAADAAGVTIAETHAFGNNPISPDEETRRKSLAACKRQLALADEIGARCCVNVAGSRGDDWMGPHPENLTGETFDRIVDSVREIVDDVDPSHAYYTLEAMPWSFPDSTDSYRRLLEAVDREQFAVHFDPVNLVSSPRRYFDTGGLIREFVDELGPYVESVHLKDIALREGAAVHFEEVRPGTGSLAYPVLLRALDELEADVPIMLEHLESEAEYELAADHVRAVAADVGVSV